MIPDLSLSHSSKFGYPFGFHFEQYGAICSNLIFKRNKYKQIKFQVLACQGYPGHITEEGEPGGQRQFGGNRCVFVCSFSAKVMRVEGCEFRAEDLRLWTQDPGPWTKDQRFRQKLGPPLYILELPSTKGENHQHVYVYRCLSLSLALSPSLSLCPSLYLSI